MTPLIPAIWSPSIDYRHRHWISLPQYGLWWMEVEGMCWVGCEVCAEASSSSYTTPPPPPLPPPPHPPNHHWCDKNFTSLRNFIYSVDIRLWLKTIKGARERVSERVSERDDVAMPWIAYANPTLGIYLMEAKGTGWLTACCPPGTLVLSSQWHQTKAITFSSLFPASVFHTYLSTDIFHWTKPCWKDPDPESTVLKYSSIL